MENKLWYPKNQSYRSHCKNFDVKKMHDSVCSSARQIKLRTLFALRFSQNGAIIISIGSGHCESPNFVTEAGKECLQLLNSRTLKISVAQTINLVNLWTALQ